LTRLRHHATDIDQTASIRMFTHRRSVHIEWGDCDPAGIIFYPRYFEIFDASTTALVEAALGMSKLRLFAAHDFSGFPLVDTRANFHRPTRFGDDVMVESEVKALRRASFDIGHRLFKDGELAVEGFETRVWVKRMTDDPGSIKAVALPPAVVERLTRG
jgi:4-hydroxybenzoyl-CoA thioesterase